jgi:hypothetical protein
MDAHSGGGARNGERPGRWQHRSLPSVGGRDEAEVGGCVSVAGETAVFEVEFDDLDGAAALFVLIPVGVGAGASRMGEVEEKGAVLVDEDVGVSAFDLIIGTSAGALEEVGAGLPCPMECVGGTIDSEAIPDVGDHPEGVVPMEHLGAFAALVSDGLAAVGPADEVGAVGVVDGFGIAFIIVPETPGAVWEAEDGSVDDAVGGEGKGPRIGPVTQVLAGELDEVARLVPVFEDTGHDGQEHLVGAVWGGDDIGGPEGGMVAGEWFGDIDDRGAGVGPRRAVVGFGDADVCAVDPCDAGETGCVGAPVGVEHPPALALWVPDHDGVCGAVVYRVAEEGFCGHGLWEWAIGNGHAEVGGAIGVPVEGLCARVAIGIAEGFAFDAAVVARVVDEEVGGAVAGGGEAVMAGAVLTVDGPGGEDWARGFGPGMGVEQVGVGIGGEEAHAVIRVGGAGGVGDKDTTVPDEHGGAFIDPVTDLFPVQVGLGELDLGLDDGPRGIHAGDIEVGIPFDVGVFLGPDEVAHAAVFEGGGVERERFPPGFDLAFFSPGTFEGVGGGVFEDAHADIPDGLGAAGGEVDVPVVVDVMEFGGPDMVAHGTAVVFMPDDLWLRMAKGVEVLGAAEFDAVVFRDGGDEVIETVVVEVDPGVGALFDEGVGKGEVLGLRREGRGDEGEAGGDDERGGTRQHAWLTSGRVGSRRPVSR